MALTIQGGITMSLVRYEPYNLFDQFNSDLSRLLGTTASRNLAAAGEWMPAVDIREEEDRYLLVADLPGVDRKDVEITVEEHVLTFKGERTTEKDESSEGYRRRERVHGEFLRQFTLPDTADTENIRATVTAGVLEIEVPKQQKLQPKKITVN
jgi:HSP20 family protein